MSVTGSQQHTFLGLLAQLRPHWRNDRALPGRVQTLLARNRAFGSRDRRLYRELIYTTLRYLPWIEPELDRNPEFAVQLVSWLAADSPATATFRAAVSAPWPACPATLAEKAALVGAQVNRSTGRDAQYDPSSLLPDWFQAECPDAFLPAQLDALLARAPLWIRLQTDDAAQVTAELDQLGWSWQGSAVLPGALRLLQEVDVTKSRAFEAGLIEIQDLGSQLLLESAAVAPGGHWLDACAGAGGKTLQLARLLGPSGQIDAFDIRASALAELATRARRAGVRTVSVLRQRPTASYDGVLVDAPCSGSGTWRRAPHLKWTTTPGEVDEAAGMQHRLLDEFSARVRPGGRLIYATCSLSHRENEDVVGTFLEAHREFSAEPPARSFGARLAGAGLSILPALHDTDGFFVAALRRAGS